MKDLLEWIVNEASRGLDEGDTREALTTIKWKVKDALAAAPSVAGDSSRQARRPASGSSEPQ